MIVALILPFFSFIIFVVVSRSFFLSVFFFIYSLGIVFKMIETLKHLYESACCIAYYLISIPVKCVHLEYKYLKFFRCYVICLCIVPHVRWFLLQIFVRLFCKWNVRTQQLTQINKKLNYFTDAHTSARRENKIVDSINKGQRLGCVAKPNSNQRELKREEKTLCMNFYFHNYWNDAHNNTYTHWQRNVSTLFISHGKGKAFPFLMLLPLHTSKSSIQSIK